MKNWSVYIVQCSDRTLYTGVSNNVEKRIQTHNLGKGASYTRSRRPVVLVYSEKAESYSTALRREAEIKKMDRIVKMRLFN